MQELLSHAAQDQTGETGAPPGSHDDEVDAVLVGESGEGRRHVRGVPALQVQGRLEAVLGGELVGPRPDSGVELGLVGMGTAGRPRAGVALDDVDHMQLSSIGLGDLDGVSQRAVSVI